MVDKSRITKTNENFKPYIFTHEQIKQIFHEADNIRTRKSVNSHIFYPAVLRVQYGCALRLSEPLGLRMRDVDLKENRSISMMEKTIKTGLSLWMRLASWYRYSIRISFSARNSRNRRMEARQLLHVSGEFFLLSFSQTIFKGSSKMLGTC